MSEEEKKAIEYFRDTYIPYGYGTKEIRNDMQILINLIKNQQKEIEKKDRIIDEMAGYLAIIRDCPNEDKGANIDCENRCSTDDDIYAECWKMYFERKV